MSARRWSIALALTAVAVAVAVPAATAQEPQRADLADISDEVMCVVCGVPIELALEAPQAQAQREFIRGLIEQGKTKDEIKDALVAEYGENVLAVPGTEGFDLAAWIVPGLALLIAAGAILFALRAWRRNRDSSSPDPGGPPDEAASERLDADLARYDL